MNGPIISGFFHFIMIIDISDINQVQLCYKTKCFFLFRKGYNNKEELEMCPNNWPVSNLATFTNIQTSTHHYRQN